MDKWSRIIPLVVVSLTAMVYAGVDDETIFRDSFENPDPVITTLPATSGRVDELYSYDVDATDPRDEALLYLLTTFPDGMSMNASSGLISWTPLAVGDYPVEIDVSNTAGRSTSQSWIITVEAAIDSDSDGLSDIREAIYGTDPGDPDSDDDGLNDGDEVNVHGSDPLDTDTDSDGLEDSDEVSNEGTDPVDPDTDGDFFGDGMEIIAGTDPLDENDFPSGPPDPVAVAPPIDPSVTTTLFESTAFLYDGEPPIQTGVQEGTIDPTRAAVLRGYVMTRDGTPLPSTVVTINNHPEYGQTISRADGMYDMVVNGGRPLTVDFVAPATLPGQRLVHVEWQTYHSVPDIALVPLDVQVTAVDLNAAVEMQVAQGSPVTDADGTRQATVLFPQGTTAMMRMPDDTMVPINDLSVRATEYTVGENGPATMPGELPPNSAYTYAVELSIDEAMAAGAEIVEFDSPIPFYVENFLDLPVGTDVPSGYYNRKQGRWVASDNGRIIEILEISEGSAVLDVDGSGTPADSSMLSALGIGNTELQRMATLYGAGQSLWRVPIAHFSSWDSNMGFWPPPDATSPRQFQRQDRNVDGCDTSSSIIECQNQVLGERVPLVGTPFFLNYWSSRMPGRLAARNLRTSISGDSVPESLDRITLIISVAGQTLHYSYPPEANQTMSFTWNGKDVYGRKLQGKQPVTSTLNYIYRPVYVPVPRFGYRGNGDEFSADEARDTISFPQRFDSEINSWDASETGLGGWSLGVHHSYDVTSRTLILGDGRQVEADTVGKIIQTHAGSGIAGYSGDGGPATQAQLDRVYGVAAAPDGSVYIADLENHRVRHVDLNGTITTVAGTGEQGFNGDNIPATEANVTWPRGLAFGPDGNLYISEDGGERIRRVDSQGMITTVAGTGVTGFSGDGGPATEAMLSGPEKIAFGPEGDLYIADSENERIRRVDSEGAISTVAGTGTAGYNGDGIIAIDAQLNDPSGVAVDTLGNLYISDSVNYRIRRVGPNGFITTFAGTGDQGFNGDGLLATQALLGQPAGIVFDSEGNLYIADDHNQRIRVVGTVGVLNTVAGSGPVGEQIGESSGDAGPATAGRISRPEDVSVGPDGRLFVAEFTGYKVRSVEAAMPGFSASDIIVPSPDGFELYRFNSSGRHLQTLNALTGTALLDFGYDAQGLLITVEDEAGNVTTIHRNEEGQAINIVAPFGQISYLTYDQNGHLQSVTNPADEAILLESTAGGLLTRFTDGNGYATRYGYDGLGRLIRAEDAAGGFQTFERTEIANGYEVTRTTALGRSANYRVEQLQTGGQRLTNTVPSGDVFQTTQNPDGSEIIQRPDGSVVQHVLSPDPRFGMQAPLSSITVSTPGGLVSETLVSQTAELDEPDNPLSLQTLTSSITVNGRTVQSVYDAATLTFTDTTPAGRQTHRTIEPSGRLAARQAAGLEASVIEYDGNGRVASMTQGEGVTARSVSFAYGVDGRLASLTDPLLREQTFEYDAAGRTVSKTLADGRSIGFDYDQNGNTTSIVVPGRPAHAFTYTPRNRVSASLPPEVGGVPAATTSIYDIDRALDLLTRPDGQVLDYAYDAAGRLMTLFVSGGQYDFSYGTANRLASITAPDGGVLTYTYDGFLLTDLDWTGAITGTVTRTYDAGFRVMSLAVNGQEVPFVYDDDDLVSQAGDLTIQRNPLNGLSDGTTLGQVTGAWTRNSFGEIETYDAEYDGSPVYAVQYDRDVLGRITQMVETVDNVQTTFDYDYDDADRLTEVKTDDLVTESYAYDANGNRLDGPLGTTTYTTDDQDRLLTMVSVGSTTVYEHNINGERTSKTLGSDIATYAYDMLGNLKTVVLTDGSEIEYLIDGRGRRIGKQVDSALVQGFLYQDGLKPVAELDGSGVVISRFVFAGNANVPAYFVKGAATYQIISDQAGSPRLVIDVATGAVAQRLDYDSFGNVTLDTNPGFQPFGFAGGLYDADTGLVRFGFRDYDPQAGRWTTKDPIAFAGGQLNLYSYAINDPVNNVDRTGLLPESAGTGIPAIDNLFSANAFFESLKNAFGYYEAIKKVDELWNRINDVWEGDEMDLAHKGKEIVSDVLEICETVIDKIPGGDNFVKKIIKKNNESAIESLDRGADALDNRAETLESIDDGSYFAPAPGPDNYHPGFTGDEAPNEKSEAARRGYERYERDGYFF